MGCEVELGGADLVEMAHVHRIWWSSSIKDELGGPDPASRPRSGGARAHARGPDPTEQEFELGGADIVEVEHDDWIVLVMISSRARDDWRWHLR